MQNLRPAVLSQQHYSQHCRPKNNQYFLQEFCHRTKNKEGIPLCLCCTKSPTHSELKIHPALRPLSITVLFAHSFSISSLYPPVRAKLFIFALFNNSSCAFLVFSSLHCQTSIAGPSSALSNENAICHGTPPISFIRLTCLVASIELSPPERKTIPGTSLGTVAFKTSRVF